MMCARRSPAMALLALGALTVSIDASAQQAIERPDRYADTATRPAAGERVGRRVNDRLNPRSRSLVIRAQGAETSRLEIPTVEANLARRR